MDATDPTTLADRARVAVADAHLRQALGNIRQRHARVEQYTRTSPGYADRRARAAAVRRELATNIDGYVDQAAASLERTGAVVHRAATPEQARSIVGQIVRDEGLTRAVKVKSMASEEIHLNPYLESLGLSVIEGDLGEYIVQVAGEPPSHIITPAIHKTLQQVADLFTPLAGQPLPVDRELLCAFARDHLRERFLSADLGITGANFLAADTGTIVLVTNEGNGRLVTTVPRVQISIVPIDKIVPRFADIAAVLPLLTRNATNQLITAYVSMTTGPRRVDEIDGPERLYVILVDHGRRDLVGTPYEEMLACIRCGACLNACPVYGTIGGHAYDSTYPGPMGSILTPLLWSGDRGRELPHASSLCGACSDACPVAIPLADMLVFLRADLRSPGPPVAPRSGAEADAVATPRTKSALGFLAWSRTWASPTAYRATNAVARIAARPLSRDGWMRDGRWWDWPGVRVLRGWASTRAVPAPAPQSFRSWWARR